MRCGLSVRISVGISVKIAKYPVTAAPGFFRLSDGNFSVSAGDIDNVSWLTKSGDIPPELFDKFSAFLKGQAEFGGSPSAVRVVQIIWFDPQLDQPAKQGRQSVDIVVHAPQQHRLREQRHAAEDKPFAGVGDLRCQFTRVIGVQDYPHW